MCQAFRKARDWVEEWLALHSSSFPPIVINITDGEATDGDPTLDSEALRSLSTSDGNVLLFNSHVSSRGDSPIDFPDTDVALPDQYAQLLFGMSSVLPPHMRALAAQEGLRVSDGT